ncbi:PAS domain-containing protein [Pelagibius marinus]|uniref:PAS domain-containing protein n=1 Tax=Pelagibius marinus TaxID=2762760 RepID=UPI001872B0D8|nr:PAS domain-containing protein [Pelagibius marinus]
MSQTGNFAELCLYRFGDGVFRNEAGRALQDCPEVLADLHGYWRSRCRGQPFPARADIDPVDIPALLEHLVLLDVLRDPLDFRYRLVGGHVVAHSRRNVQGQTVRSLMADGGPRAQALQEKALIVGEALATSQAPLFIDLSYGAPDGRSRKRLQGLLLPLGEPGKAINMVLGGLHYLA